MAIYTRFGSELRLIEARVIPVWIERLRSEIKWHYKEKKPTKRTVEIDELPQWFVRAEYVDGGPACDGKWLVAHTLVADKGSKEIEEACRALNPKHAHGYEAWSFCNAKASAIFDPVDEKEVA